MMRNLLANKVAPVARMLSTSAVRRAHDTSGIVGSTLPFSIKNKYLLTLGFIIFFGSGLGAPFLIVRHNILKQS